MPAAVLHTPLWQSSSRVEQSFGLCTHRPPLQLSVVHGLLSLHAPEGVTVTSLWTQPFAPQVSGVCGFLSSQFGVGCEQAPVVELHKSSVQGLPSEQSFAESTWQSPLKH